MTPKQAAAIIGVSPQQVRTLIRTGKLKAREVITEGFPGFHYDISRKEVTRRAKLTRAQMLTKPK